MSTAKIGLDALLPFEERHMPQTLTINGKARSVDVDDGHALLWVLRDVLGMTGTKFGCGLALCGACTVHVDGKPVRSCITPVFRSGRQGHLQFDPACWIFCQAAAGTNRLDRGDALAGRCGDRRDA